MSAAAKFNVVYYGLYTSTYLIAWFLSGTWWVAALAAFLTIPLAFLAAEWLWGAERAAERKAAKS